MTGDWRLYSGIRGFLITLVVGSLTLSAGLGVVYNFYYQREVALEYTRGALEMLVTAGAISIRGEDILELNRKEDYRKPAYARVYRVLKEIYLSNRTKSLGENTIYVLKPNRDNSGTIFAAHLPGDSSRPSNLGTLASMEDDTVNYIGSSYEITPLMREILAGKKSFGSTGIFTDSHGVWISAYAPIKTESGRIVALLDASYRFSEVYEQIKMRFYGGLVAILVAAFLALILIIIFSGWITGPIREIANAVDRLAKGDFKVRVKLNRKDELGSLGKHFNHMARVMEEKVELSRYVSRETMRKVEAHQDSEDRAIGERTVLCVFFSDIRGFTKYAARESVEKVVEVLNEILLIQTNIILSRGGSVDKFVGDEIMATFEGDDMVYRAVMVAREINRSLEGIKQREGLAVGIGIHFGVVIRGDMGSLNRMDYTIIGNTVNLTARLCGGARPGQVFITEETHLMLVKTFGEEMSGRYIGRGKFKGLDEPLRIYDVSRPLNSATVDSNYQG